MREVIRAPLSTATPRSALSTACVNALHAMDTQAAPVICAQRGHKGREQRMTVTHCTLSRNGAESSTAMAGVTAE